MTGVIAFARSWYGFIVGDGWRVAVGVGAGIALTRGACVPGVSAWWLVPVVVVALFPSLWRATGRRA